VDLINPVGGGSREEGEGWGERIWRGVWGERGKGVDLALEEFFS